MHYIQIVGLDRMWRRSPSFKVHLKEVRMLKLIFEGSAFHGLVTRLTKKKRERQSDTVWNVDNNCVRVRMDRYSD